MEEIIGGNAHSVGISSKLLPIKLTYHAIQDVFKNKCKLLYRVTFNIIYVKV